MKKQPYFSTWSKQNAADSFEFIQADATTLTLADDKKLIDMTSISYQAILGHNHPHLQNALIEQVKLFSIASPKANFKLKYDTSQKLLSLMQKNDGKIFYTVSGAEAIENALKMARDVTQKNFILARSKSYHGATLGALSVTGDWRNEKHLGLPQYTVRIPEPKDDLDCTKTREIILATGAENIAAFCLETITGANGVFIPPQKWWDQIMKLAKEFNILIILDEVVCGFYRTGKAFGYMHYNIKADIICLAKGITAGMIPFGALWASEKIAKHYEKNILSQGLTNYAHPLGLKLLNSVIDILDDTNVNQSRIQIENALQKNLERFKQLKCVVDIRCIGSLAVIETNIATLSWKHFYDLGLYLMINKNLILLAPAFVMQLETLNQALDIIYDDLAKT